MMKPLTRISPKCASDLPAYILAFEDCANYSAALDAGDAPMKIRPRPLPQEDLSAALAKVIYRHKITEDDFRGAAGQCLKWAHFLAPAIEDALGRPAWPTLGQLWNGDTKVWGPSWGQLDEIVRTGIQPQHAFLSRDGGLNIHAWVTLESGQIIDLTFASTLAVFRSDSFAHMLGMISGGDEPKLFNNHRFFPMMAGQRAFERLSDLSMVKLLASTRQELAQYSAAMLLGQ